MMSNCPNKNPHFVEVSPCGDTLPKIAVAMFKYGGVHGKAHSCMVRDVAHSAQSCGWHNALDRLAGHGINLTIRDIPRKLDLVVIDPVQDAMIDRSRARVAQAFLQQFKDCEVLVMIDHDMEWRGKEGNYEGDLAHIARLAVEHDAVVGAFVSKRVRGQGAAHMHKAEGDFDLGDPGLVELWYAGAGMTAYPRTLLQDVTDTTKEIPPGYAPIFMPMVVDHPVQPGKQLALSEDWALSYRAAELGYKSYGALKPLVGHWGDYCYDVVNDAMYVEPKEDNCNECKCVAEQKQPNTATSCVLPRDEIKISLLHATRGRKQMATNAYKTWLARCNDPSRLEYILSLDSDDDTDYDWLELKAADTAIYGANRGNVDAYNAALRVSSGHIIVQMHDDVTPPLGWDDALIDAIGDVTKPCVLHVNDGLPKSVNNKPWLIPILIGTRAWFEKCGFFFHPKYISVFCDDDASQTAIRAGVVKDASDLTFKHAWSGADHDETQRRSYSADNWQRGQLVYNEREIDGFPTEPQLQYAYPQPR